MIGTVSGEQFLFMKDLLYCTVLFQHLCVLCLFILVECIIWASNMWQEAEGWRKMKWPKHLFEDVDKVAWVALSYFVCVRMLFFVGWVCVDCKKCSLWIRINIIFKQKLGSDVVYMPTSVSYGQLGVISIWQSFRWQRLKISAFWRETEDIKRHCKTEENVSAVKVLVFWECQ
jgi:hypothetical protein